MLSGQPDVGSVVVALLRTDDRGGNPRFDINLSTPLSERCSPSCANAALSTAPLRNVKLSLSTKVALFSSSFLVMLVSQDTQSNIPFNFINTSVSSRIVIYVLLLRKIEQPVTFCVV